MGKIVYIMGKSASGKDTIYSALMLENRLGLKPVVPYTTRPIRAGETQGKEYHFVDLSEVERLQNEGKIIELRTYHTVLGDWHYFTADDGSIDLSRDNYLMIGTLESYQEMRDYFGDEAMVPIYICLDDGERLARAVKRERLQQEPNYKEVCRRFLADEEDFSDIHLEEANITERFFNMDLRMTLANIEEYLEKTL